MDESQMRKLLIEQLHGYLAILLQRGIPFGPPTDEELAKFPVYDLQTIVQKARDLARSPTV